VPSNFNILKFISKVTAFGKLTCFVFILITLTCNKAFSQTKDIAEEENKVAEFYSKLKTFIQADYDSINFYSGKFEEEFIFFIKNNPNTLNYSFKKLIDSNFCEIITSGDGKFRIYSWDTWTGGTMHFFKEIYQWKTNGKVFSKLPEYEEHDPGNFCSKIFTVSIHNKPYYLAVTNGIYSTTDAMQSISVYTIEGNELIDTVKLFRTKTKKLNSIDVEFDFFSVVDRPERPLELIVYDDKQKIIYIPVVDDKEQVTKKYILYQLKGGYFEYIGTKCTTKIRDNLITLVTMTTLKTKNLISLLKSRYKVIRLASCYECWSLRS
jgi:hypothetical protein